MRKKTTSSSLTGDHSVKQLLTKNKEHGDVDGNHFSVSEFQEFIERTKESTKTQKELTKQLSELTKAIQLISEHEFTQIHRSKWSIFLYQLSLGMLFAIGTVLGLATFSWSVYTFFKDSQILRQIVDKQLNSRNFNFTEIREKAIKDARNTSNTGTTLSKEAPTYD